jgi:hypothetical protein
MDAAIVRMVLTAIAENNPSQFEPREPAEAVTWLKRRIRITRNDKGGGVQYNPEIEAAARAAERAVALYQHGDVEAAKPLALEALKMLNG